MATNDRILVSVSEMEATISKYESARSILHDAYSKLDSAKEHLDNCYKGPAYMALSAKYVSIYMNVKTADKAIDESVNGLRNTINEMKEAESTNVQGAANLGTGSAAPTYL